MAEKGKQYEIVTPVVRANNKWLHPGEVGTFTKKAADILLRMGAIKPIKGQAKAPEPDITEE